MKTIIWLASFVSSCAAAASNCSFWLEDVKHQGVAAFNPNSSTFQVFRNVKDYGAVGDGVADDTAAINAAIKAFNTCTPDGSCMSNSNGQALVYFPSGTYMISRTVIQNFGVTLYGNPNCLPTIKATSNFTNGIGETGLIDGDPNDPATGMGWILADNIFYRSLRNFIIDTTNVSPSQNVTGIHWPSAQATGMTNVIFNMPTVPGVQHIGLIIDAGGMLFFNDLTFNGGNIGFYFHVSQVVTRNLKFNNCVYGIYINEVWSLSGTQMSWNNCSVGIQNTIGNGTMVLADSYMRNTAVGIASGFGNTSAYPATNNVILENVQINGVPIVVQNAGSTPGLLGGNGTSTISGYGQGNSIIKNIPGEFIGSIEPAPRQAGLVATNGKDWYYRSKPSYQTLPASSFVSARTSGAKGDGITDDTKAMQAAINSVAKSSKILFLDQGSYKITSTLSIPANTKIVGEAFPKIFASGSYFANVSSPVPLLQVGKPGEKGSVELSDFIIATQGSTGGAVLIEHNLASDSSAVGGYWDVDTLIGGWAGSELSLAYCPTTPNMTAPPVNQSCMSTYMSMHITPSASGVYMENCWLWTANFDLDDYNYGQVQVYSGRGMLIDSEVGNNWFYCVPVEHHSKYAYNFVNTKNIYFEQNESESPYFQPNPNASYPYPYNATLHDPIYPDADDLPTFNSTTLTNFSFPGPPSSDPTYSSSIEPVVAPAAMAWSQIITNSSNITIYSTAYFAWYNDWAKGCTSNHTCQQSAMTIDAASRDITIYAFTIGNMQNLIESNGVEIVAYNTSFGRPNDIGIFKQ